MNTYKPYLAKTVNVVLSTMTINGVLINVTKDALILTKATALEENGQSQPIDGTVIIPGITIEWVQVN